MCVCDRERERMCEREGRKREIVRNRRRKSVCKREKERGRE